jgi:diguanylate cyclase (GGDEF)-like protein
MHETSIRDGKPLVPGGARELRTLTDAYNDMYERNNTTTESLRYEARNDALTGLLNRGAYDELLFLHKRSSALILVDIDYFKQFNDEFGHEMGDAILIEVAATLYASFRSNDYVCRIGGDEFAVIMTNATPDLRDVIAHKIDKVAAFLHDTSNGLPSVNISVGVAFGNPQSTEDGLFKEADTALYDTKRRGRNGYTFANEL